MCECYIRTHWVSHGNPGRFSWKSIGNSTSYSMNFPEDLWNGSMRKTQLTQTESRAGLLGGLGISQIPLCGSMHIVQECRGRSLEVQKNFNSTQGRVSCGSHSCLPPVATDRRC